MNTREIARGGLLAGLPSCCCISADSIPAGTRPPALVHLGRRRVRGALIRSFALRTSLTVYAAVSALSLMLVPRKSVAAAYIAALRPDIPL